MVAARKKRPTDSSASSSDQVSHVADLVIERPGLPSLTFPISLQGPTSLFLFTTSSPPRRLAIWLINWPVFEWTIIITIILNCAVMALDNKLPNNDMTPLSAQMVQYAVTRDPVCRATRTARCGAGGCRGWWPRGRRPMSACRAKLQ